MKDFFAPLAPYLYTTLVWLCVLITLLGAVFGGPIGFAGGLLLLLLALILRKLDQIYNG